MHAQPSCGPERPSSQPATQHSQRTAIPAPTPPCITPRPHVPQHACTSSPSASVHSQARHHIPVLRTCPTQAAASAAMAPAQHACEGSTTTGRCHSSTHSLAGRRGAGPCSMFMVSGTPASAVAQAEQRCGSAASAAPAAEGPAVAGHTPVVHLQCMNPVQRPGVRLLDPAAPAPVPQPGGWQGKYAARPAVFGREPCMLTVHADGACARSATR